MFERGVETRQCKGGKGSGQMGRGGEREYKYECEYECVNLGSEWLPTFLALIPWETWLYSCPTCYVIHLESYFYLRSSARFCFLQLNDLIYSLHMVFVIFLFE
jgi:hypothetical protein